MKDPKPSLQIAEARRRLPELVELINNVASLIEDVETEVDGLFVCYQEIEDLENRVAELEEQIEKLKGGAK